MADLYCSSATLLFLVFSVGMLCTALPVPVEQSPDGPHDVRWRLDIGMQALAKHVVSWHNIFSNFYFAVTNPALPAFVHLQEEYCKRKKVGTGLC